MILKLGLLPLGRPTFDVPFAEEKLAAMCAALDATGHEIAGPRTLLFDAGATEAAIADLQAAGIDQLLILQVTFTDTSMTVAAAHAFPDTPLSLWAVPEPRLGGRLRLNAFCGLNLASHALGRAERGFGWLFADPAGDVAADLKSMLAGHRPSGRMRPHGNAMRTTPEAEDIADRIATRRIARIGAHPDGFTTCAYDPDEIERLAGVTVDEIPLERLFDDARALPEGAEAAVRAAAEAQMTDLDSVDQAELTRSLRLKTALDGLRAQGDYDAFAIRCWPETFTEYGGAVCGPVAMMGEARVPCACEADVYGALTQLVLQETAQDPVFLADLVDIDTADGTGVVWHCGQAPISMRDPDVAATATVHTNRRMPLLYEFPLKPGRVTFLRISQAFGRPKMVIAAGEMLKRPMAFTGTSGVVRFDNPAGQVLADVIASGLEHHVALAYGDHRQALRDVAGAMHLPVMEL